MKCQRIQMWAIIKQQGMKGARILKPINARKTNPEVRVLMTLGAKNNGAKGLNQKARRLQNLDYIFEMLREMRNIAKATGELSLIYYLEMAAMEAGDAGDVIRMANETNSDQPISGP